MRNRSRRRLPFGLGRAVPALLVLGAVAILAAALSPRLDPIGGTARASDGDSFRMGDQRIRLVGLDAPELDQTCEDRAGEIWPCGRVARERMAELLNAGALTCQPQDRDQYGRLLATCQIGERDLAQIMVAEGLAVASGDYQNTEREARTAQRGIWDGTFEHPRAWRDGAGQGAGENWLNTLLGW